MLVNSPMRMVLSGAGLLVLGGCGLGSGQVTPELAPDQAQVGYGTRAESKITGAVTSLSDDELSAARPMRIEDLLRGRVAGLQFIQNPNGTTTVRIRGMNSLLNDREPLIVVDGIPTHERLGLALMGLLPEDIKRIDVLKDIASTSVYGMRGSGGVILITTRR